MKTCIKVLKVIMVPLVAIYPLYMNILGGLVFILNSKRLLKDELITENVASLMQLFAGIMFVSSVFFSAAMIFALCKFNKVAVSLDIAAILMCVASAILMNSLTLQNELELVSVKPLSNNILINHLPTVIPFLAILIVGLVQNLIRDTALGPAWDNFKQTNAENKKIIRDGKKIMKKPLTDAEEAEAANEDNGRKTNSQKKKPKKSGKKKN